jgi:hypothetical protein
MARYSVLLGRRVEVHYRAGDILLPASGTLVADSGRAIFLEQSLVQRGQPKYFRWEIPYQFIVRLEEKTEGEGPGNSAAIATEGSRRPGDAQRRAASSAAATASAGTPSMLPLPNRPKTA